MDKPIRVVFFDMGDTLTTILPSWETLYINVCAARGIHLEHDALAAATRAVFGELDADESRMTYEASADADQRYYRDINGEILRRAGDGDAPDPHRPARSPWKRGFPRRARAGQNSGGRGTDRGADVTPYFPRGIGKEHGA